MGRLHSRGKVLELEMDLMMLNIAKCFVVLMCQDICNIHNSYFQVLMYLLVERRLTYPFVQTY